jgi:hypothetical protein
MMDSIISGLGCLNFGFNVAHRTPVGFQLLQEFADSAFSRHSTLSGGDDAVFPGDYCSRCCSVEVIITFAKLYSGPSGLALFSFSISRLSKPE